MLMANWFFRSRQIRWLDRLLLSDPANCPSEFIEFRPFLFAQNTNKDLQAPIVGLETDFAHWLISVQISRT